MVKLLIEILNSDNWEDGDEKIQFAKGKYKGVTYLQKIKQWLRK